MRRVGCSQSQIKKGAVQIVLSSGNPFRPKGLAHSLHLLRPPGAWFLIRGPRFSSPGPEPSRLLSSLLLSVFSPSLFFPSLLQPVSSSSQTLTLHPSPPKKTPHAPSLLPGDFLLSFHSSVLASSPHLSSPPPAPLLLFIPPSPLAPGYVHLLFCLFALAQLPPIPA